MSDNRSPRVNKARMADYKGRTVRLIVKILSFRDDVAIAEASDSGEVEIQLLKDVKIESAFIEVIGQVVDERTIKMMGCIQLSNDVDMKLANDVVEVWHDPKFASMF
ncbi:replication factor A protein 3 [Trametes gibbosa]|nr:replication factor A protein 3 [Trametes gibbosa]